MNDFKLSVKLINQLSKYYDLTIDSLIDEFEKLLKMKEFEDFTLIFISNNYKICIRENNIALLNLKYSESDSKLTRHVYFFPKDNSGIAKKNHHLYTNQHGLCVQEIQAKSLNEKIETFYSDTYYWKDERLL